MCQQLLCVMGTPRFKDVEEVINSVESDGAASSVSPSSPPPRIEVKLRDPSPEDEARTQPRYTYMYHTGLGSRSERHRFHLLI